MMALFGDEIDFVFSVFFISLFPLFYFIFILSLGDSAFIKPCYSSN